MKKKKSVKNNMSLSVSQRVITLLIEEGKMSVDQIAETIGRSKIFVNRVIRGEARLSAEELGKLTKCISSFAKSISSSLINKISAITMDDVKDAAEKVKSAAENAVKGTPGFTIDVLKKTSRETGKILQATGAFLKGLGY